MARKDSSEKFIAPVGSDSSKKTAARKTSRCKQKSKLIGSRGSMQKRRRKRIEW